MPPQKTRRRGSREFSGGCTFCVAVGGVRATDAPNRYVPTSGNAKTAARGQRNAGIGCDARLLHANATNGGQGLRCRDVPEGASDLSKTGGSYDGNDGFHIKRCPKKRGEEEAVSFRAVVPFIWQLEVSGQRTHLIGTSLHPASRKTAAGGQRNTGIRYDERRARLMLANTTNGGE